MDFNVTPVMLGVANVGFGVAALVLARLLKSVLTPYRTDEELTQKDNPAFGLALTGYYGAVVTIYVGVARELPLDTPAPDVLLAVLANLGWTMTGVIALALSRWLLSSWIIAGTTCSAEIVRNRNVAAGAVECGGYVASGLVLAGALREPGGTWLTALVFFLLSQIALLAFGRLYQRFTGYDTAGEIAGGNLAAGTAFGLTLVAISLLMFKGTTGGFVDWQTNLLFFGLDVTIGFLLLIGLRWITELALLPNARITEEIVRDRNVNVGLIEGVIAIAAGLLILFIF